MRQKRGLKKHAKVEALLPVSAGVTITETEREAPGYQDGDPEKGLASGRTVAARPA